LSYIIIPSNDNAAAAMFYDFWKSWE